MVYREPSLTHTALLPVTTINLPGRTPANLRPCNSGDLYPLSFFTLTDYRALTRSPALPCGRRGATDLPGRTPANLRPRNSGDHHPRGSRSQVIALTRSHCSASCMWPPPPVSDLAPPPASNPCPFASLCDLCQVPIFFNRRSILTMNSTRALSKLVTEQNALGLNQIYIYIQVLILSG
ncbi:uncharacterized protein LOC107634687 isoform X2 [Arachis ipaensis]|uniref:uncharacterized protein LOC107634687 isoform X2 n=1 Tax=Arachis ipaensis TaxID=130454 RepID=UPI000A2B6671|nr:uncharacterized protein LOC107634687 isoform X2 [Arachis ipaensis]